MPVDEEKLLVDVKDEAVATDFAECGFKEFSPDSFGLKSASGPYPRPPLHELLKRVSGNFGDCPKQLIDFLMKGIELAPKEDHPLCPGGECLDSGIIRASARRMTSRLSAKSAAFP
jgi:hypothetical protein